MTIDISWKEFSLFIMLSSEMLYAKNNIQLLILTHLVLSPDSFFIWCLSNLRQSPMQLDALLSSQKDLALSLTISDFLSDGRLKNNTSFFFLFITKSYIFCLFSRVCFLPLRNFIFSYFCNNLFQQRKSLCLNASFTLVDCDVVNQTLKYSTASWTTAKSRLLNAFTYFTKQEFKYKAQLSSQHSATLGSFKVITYAPSEDYASSKGGLYCRTFLVTAFIHLLELSLSMLKHKCS